jgi:hypothetical protein
LFLRRQVFHAWFGSSYFVWIPSFLRLRGTVLPLPFTNILPVASMMTFGRILLTDILDQAWLTKAPPEWQQHCPEAVICSSKTPKVFFWSLKWPDRHHQTHAQSNSRNSR